MQYIQLFEDFGNEYYNTIALLIKNAIIKLHYDTKRPVEDVIVMLIKQGISKPMSTKIGRFLTNNHRFDPNRIDNYIDDVINHLKPNDGVVTFRFEAYGDFIGKGFEHTVTDIDDDYILKCPTERGEGALEEFNFHIRIMQKYPTIFANVKRLSKYRASVEKLDIDRAKDELDYILKKVPYRIGTPITTKSGLLQSLYNKDRRLLGLKEYADGHNCSICQKWYDFFVRLKQSGLEYETDDGVIDLHQGNIGLDKNNNIKLLDF